VKKLAAIALILLLLGGLAACQAAGPAPAPIIATIAPTVTHTPLPPTITPTPTAEPLPPLNSPNGPPLRLIRMFNAKDGWGLISNSLLVTHDGGLTWFSVPIPEGQVDPLSDILFIDVNNLYIHVPAPDQHSGLLYHTINGGGTWEMKSVPFVHGHFVIQDNVAYFMETTSKSPEGEAVVIHLSVDYGATWKKVSPSDGPEKTPAIPEAGLKTGFSFINVDLGWLGVAEQPQKIVVYRTENTGNNWVPQPIPEPQNISDLKASTYPPMFFVDNNQAGILPVDFTSITSGDQKRVFYTTTDGGQTWLPGEAVADGGAYTFLNPKTGWAWGKGGVYYTEDGGQTWLLRPIAFGRSEHATCLSFIDATTGWMVTADAKNRVRIYHTNDSGNTWMAVNP